MAKSGSKEWYKEKYEAAKEDLDTAKKQIKLLKTQVKSLGESAQIDGVVLAVSRVDARRQQRLNLFLEAAVRTTRRTKGQIAAACVTYLAENTRSGSVRGLLNSIKHTKGTGLR